MFNGLLHEIASRRYAESSSMARRRRAAYRELTGRFDKVVSSEMLEPKRFWSPDSSRTVGAGGSLLGRNAMMLK
jgi:hypothetical protein